IPVDNRACLVAKGNRADEKPSVFSIETPQTRFHLTRRPRSHDCLKLVKEPLEVFGMICNLPSPTGLCSLRQARIVMPSLVMEFIGTVWQSAPHQRWDRVDHHPIFVFGVRHFVDGFVNFRELESTTCPVRQKSTLDLIGGADADRTRDLLNAIQALSQTELQPHRRRDFSANPM